MPLSGAVARLLLRSASSTAPLARNLLFTVACSHSALTRQLAPDAAAIVGFSDWWLTGSGAQWKERARFRGKEESRGW